MRSRTVASSSHEIRPWWGRTRPTAIRATSRATSAGVRPVVSTSQTGTPSASASDRTRSIASQVRFSRRSVAVERPRFRSRRSSSFGWQRRTIAPPTGNRWARCPTRSWTGGWASGKDFRRRGRSTTHPRFGERRPHPRRPASTATSTGSRAPRRCRAMALLPVPGVPVSPIQPCTTGLEGRSLMRPREARTSANTRSPSRRTEPREQDATRAKPEVRRRTHALGGYSTGH
jgi:hypothetical protein